LPVNKHLSMQIFMAGIHYLAGRHDSSAKVRLVAGLVRVGEQIVSMVD
jgi:hypothetical protein